MKGNIMKLIIMLFSLILTTSTFAAEVKVQRIQMGNKMEVLFSGSNNYKVEISTERLSVYPFSNTDHPGVAITINDNIVFVQANMLNEYNMSTLEFVNLISSLNDTKTVEIIVDQPVKGASAKTYIADSLLIKL